MILFYIMCLAVSIILFLLHYISDERQSVIQHIMLVILIITNSGYLAFFVSSDINEAMLACKVLYLGGCFLPMLYCITLAEMCHIYLNRKLITALAVVQMIVYGFVCTIGWNELYYSNVEFYINNGVPVLTKQYGLFHALYPLTMCAYWGIAFAIAIYAISKKTSVNIRGIRYLLIFFMIAILCYLYERFSGIDYKIMPLAYDVLMIGSVIHTYRTNLFTIEENKSIITEQLENIGFVAFDRKINYMGCNPCAVKIFPILKGCQIGKKILGDDIFFKEKVIDKVVKFSYDVQANVKRHTHMHKKIGTFTINGNTYDCIIHTLLNCFGKCVGYAVEINDETEHYKSIELFNNYNKILKQNVDKKTAQIRNIQERVILGMAQMVESRDLSTGGHIRRTSEVVRIFADELLESNYGLSEEFLELVVRSAPMHDLGKIGVDDAVLRKQGKFTDEEYTKMKEHAVIGAGIVKKILTDVEDEKFVTIATNIAHYHHEKVNGYGYPDGLKGNQIPIEARIMALADVFDALVSKRCYKDAFSFERAFSIIKEDAGSHFDASLTDVFLKCRPKLEQFYNSCEH